jgi:hypothetical protein
MDLGTYLPIDGRVGKKGIKYEIHKRTDARTAIKDNLSLMRSGGTTALCDFREGGLEGIRLLKSVLNMQARILGRPKGSEDVLKECDGFGISSIKDYDGAELRRILSGGFDKLIGIHAAEASDDVDEVLKIDPDFIVHLTNAGEKSRQKVFKRKIPLVLCPRANASFGVGIPDLKSIFEDACLVALGTDNVMANSTNMWREMEFLWKLYRGLYRDHGFEARAVLKAATLNGRKTLNLPVNSITEGNKADFLITKGLKFASDPVVALVHRVELGDIKEVVSPTV